MAINILKRKIKNKVWLFIKNHFSEQRGLDWTIIQNLNYNHMPSQKKAVVCYRTDSYFNNWEEVNSGRTQPFEIFSIIRVLSRLEYCIDLIDCNDLSSLPHIANKRYELIFGFGECFYQLTQQQPMAQSVLYMTEQHPEFSYREEQKRVNYFNQRHNKQIKIARSGIYYKLHHLEPKYSNIIVMGEVEPFNEQYKYIHTIFPTGLQHPEYIYTTKNHNLSRKHFLWLGTSGAAIHKGLDLLLDIFSQRDDIVLHIGGITAQDKKILHFPEKSNIKDHGFINVKSDIFLKLIEECSYILLPSCSEACATSVTTGMLHGLIPVVMKDAGFNRLDTQAIFLSDFKLSYLDEQLTNLANQSSKMLEERSLSAYKFAHEKFSIKTFEQSIFRIMEEIVTISNKKNIYVNELSATSKI